jgi:ADP-ribosyl-[dinitrogen reductase] hydrolase
LSVSLGDRLAGAVWGHLIGDSVGVPYEFRPPMEPSKVRFGATGTHDQPPGTWSDDGALMLALLDSLLEKGFDTADQGQRALSWYRGTAYTPDGDGRFDNGEATAEAMHNLERGVAPEDAGPTHDRACGNGSLMRILPLALGERDSPAETLVDHAHRASRVTHGHLRPQVTCALYVLIAHRLVSGRTGRRAILKESSVELRELYESEQFGPAYVAALDELEAWNERSGTGFVLDTFWSAWDAFLRADSYEDTIRRAVAYGHDTDTTAAIGGGLAGLRWGISGIPSQWLAGMRGRNTVDPLVERLVAPTIRKYRIYVIKLDEAVWKKPKFRRRNPDRDMRKPCVYVGYSEHTAEERFEQHRAGINDSSEVRQHGIKLTPRLYRNAPVSTTRDDAELVEERWAQHLRRKGYGVWEGRLGPLGLPKKSEPVG